MKRTFLALCAALPLAACTTDGGYYGGASVGYGAPIAYDGYYDDHYGPIYDGYWGDGGAFYYRTREHGHFRHDNGQHFRRDMGEQQAGGFHPMHGTSSGDNGRHHHRDH